MKKILFSLILAVGMYYPAVVMAQKLSPEQQAEKIYSACEEQIPEVTEKQVIKGNIADVLRERQLRQCIKDKTVEIAASFMAADELDNFRQQLDKLEKTFFDVYRLLIFCRDDGDENWCKQFYQEDSSLGKLLLEKNINAHIMRLLAVTIDTKQGGMVF